MHISSEAQYHNGLPHVEVLLLDGVVGAGDHERVLAVPEAAEAVVVEPRDGVGAAPVAVIYIRSLFKDLDQRSRPYQL